MYNNHEPADSGTDTDTASSVGEVWYEYDGSLFHPYQRIYEIVANKVLYNEPLSTLDASNSVMPLASVPWQVSRTIFQAQYDTSTL